MSDDTVQISDQEVLLIKDYAEHNCGIEMCLEQAEIICLSLNNTQRYPDGWNESNLADELHHRFSD
jgi:hypothetical protein